MPCLSKRLGRLSAEDLDAYTRLTDAFESAWSASADGRPAVEDFLPEPPAEPLTGLVLVQNLKVELEWRAERGAWPSPEELLGRFPALREDHESRVEVFAWGSRLADAAAGQGCAGFDLPGLVERFPDDQAALIACRAALYREQGGAFPPELVPAGYTLLHELRGGGMSRLALVWNERVGREEVLKLLDRDAGDPKAVRRFWAVLSGSPCMLCGQAEQPFGRGLDFLPRDAGA